MKNICLLILICLFSMIFVSCGEGKTTEEKPGSQQNSSLIWSVKTSNKLNWLEAKDYCQNLTEREQSDWHLPTIEELRTLIQSCQGTIPGGSCAVSETCGGDYCLDENCQTCSQETDGSYSRLGDTNQLWSATSVSNYDPAAWYVDFSNAGIYQDEKESYRYARCTRIAKGSERKRDCQELPDKAVWNTVSEITQTWNGEEWIPATTASYNEEASSAECRFKCAENYEWDGSVCVNAKRSAECTGLPENAEWNTVSSITQTWNDEDWVPSTAGNYDTNPSSAECRFKCAENYEWDGSACANAKRRSECTGLPANAVWNSASSITQTWNGSDWVPVTAGTYDTNPSSAECRFKCDQNYEWNSSTSKCVAATRQAACSSKPANSVWNDSGADGKFTQTWNGSEWIPESYDSTYSMTAGTCVYNCDSSHFWDNSGCTSPCDYAPCSEITNSTKTCTATSWKDYACGCKYGYFWDGNECKKQISVGNICTNQEICYGYYNSDYPLPDCSASSSENYFGQDAYYADLGLCTPQSFTVTKQKIVFDNNTGLQWQQNAPATKYTWEGAKNYCSNLTYSDYSDWRVPDPEDFLTIIDHSRYAPAVNTDYFTSMSSASSSVYYWTSKNHRTYEYEVYLFNLYYGFIETNMIDDIDQNSSLNVVCVRGNKLAKGSFTTSTIEGDIVVPDSTSGLMWQKTLEDFTSYTWVRALKYCENLEYAGYSDWRLPNKNELASLLNYDKSDTHFSDFPDMEGQDFWSSTTHANHSGSAWRVYFYEGGVDDDSKSHQQKVRCVRSE